VSPREAVRTALFELLDSEIGGSTLTDVVEEHLGRGLTPAEREEADRYARRVARRVLRAK
jgi:hypothetical protein